MTTWNFRVLETEDGYGVHEVYYDNDLVVGFTETPCVGPCDTYEELVEELEHISRAFNESVLSIQAIIG